MDDTKAPPRKASIKETGEELSAADWARFEAAADAVRRERRKDMQDTSRAPAPSDRSRWA